MQILLTIGIPVFNGGKTIKETLESIRMQDVDLNNIEILVSDNNSSDDTLKICKSYKNIFPNFSIYTNDSNFGFDKNVDLVIKRAKGKYVWLLGDDDNLKQNSLSFIKSIINKGEYSYIFCNYSVTNRENGKLIVYKYKDLEADIICKGPNSIISKISIYPNFVSSCIFNKYYWESIKDREKYYGTKWMHYCMFLEVISFSSVYLVSYPYVENKGIGNEYGNANGIALSLLCDIYYLIRKIQKSLTFKSIYLIKKELKKQLLKKISSSRRNGLKLSWSLLIRTIDIFYIFPTFWLFYLPLLILPNEFHKSIYRIYKKRKQF